MKKSDAVRTNGRTSTTYMYTPYDPLLQIGGKEIPFIHQSSMRFLPQEIFKGVRDKEIRSGVEYSQCGCMKTIL